MARELVRDAIVSAGIRVDVDDATVAVSEIVSNVVRHAGTAMLVNVVAGPYLRVEVTDSRPELPVPQPGRSNGGGGAVHGRGLRLGPHQHDTDARQPRWMFTRKQRSLSCFASSRIHSGRGAR